MTHTVVVTIAMLAVVGEVAAALIVVAAVLRVVGIAAPLSLLRALVWGYELWLAFVVAAVATGGSLFFSEVAGFVPCELCWFQRIFMYPLGIVTLLAVVTNAHRVARSLLPLPVI